MKNAMKKILINKNMPPEMRASLNEFQIITSCAKKGIENSLALHPDMQFFCHGDFKICDKNLHSYYKNFFEDIKASTFSGTSYPTYIGLNGLVFEDKFIHNLKYTDPLILDYMKEKHIDLIHVNQGYSKCNVLACEDVLITSDKMIYEKTKGFCHALLIRPGGIRLKDFPYGFIGGASGVINNKIYFTGVFEDEDIKEQVLSFLDRHGKEYVFLSKLPLEDFGSILEI